MNDTNSTELARSADPAPAPAPVSAQPAATLGDAPKALVPRGNPFRLSRGGATALAGSLVAFLLMAHAGHGRWGVPIGALFIAVAAWGVMDLLGTFDDPDDRVAASTTLAALARPLARLVAWVLAFFVSLGMAVAGHQPQVLWGTIATAAFAASSAEVFHVGRALGAWADDARPFWRHEGFWVVAAGAALYFPLMGTSSLWDPWETHYGEVAREMLARDDWVSLWWAQDGWFWSKPVLDMWMQALSMAPLGVHFQPDKMLIGDGTQPVMHPEWAVRAPVVMLTILAMYLLYKGVARSFGRRAALLGALVLATMPDWFFLAHQTMTDMPFVAAMTASMGLVMLGLRADPEQLARVYEVRATEGLRFRLSAWHLVFGAVLMCALPQILYLLSRNVEFMWHAGAHGFRPHWDEFRSGSGMGNCGLPGNEECRTSLPASIPHSAQANPTSLTAGLWRAVGAVEPVVQVLIWSAVLGASLYLSWGERRVQRLYYLGGWFFAAISTLGKGPAGIALPMLVTFTYLCASRPGEDLLARILRVIGDLGKLEIVAGTLMLLAVSMPWYVAMYVRHGPPFTDRLIFHDMFNRAFSHVHDTNEGDDTSFRFYVWQLGYALFPWTGLAPLALLWWMRRGSAEGRDAERTDASVLLCMWFVFAFALFSFMGTKFHHYIFPAVPPVAMLIGVLLDDVLEEDAWGDVKHTLGYFGAMAAGLAAMALGVARMMPGSAFGTKPDGHLASPSVVTGLALLVAGAAAVVLAARLAPAATRDSPRVDDHTSRIFAGGAIAAALLLIVVSRDLAITPPGADQPGAIRLLQLFTYNYRRGWPESLDFSAPLAGFGAVTALLCVALALRPIRRHAIVGLLAFGLIWGAWGLDVYMQKTAQHWGQHEVIAEYYAKRASANEKLVAYQMNWKGENFYTGNHVPAFVSTGSTFTSWLKKEKDGGARVMFFITEHGRIGGLKSEVGARSYTELTDKTLCNKFVLVRAEL